MPHWKELLSTGQAIDLSITEGKSEETFLSVIEDLFDDSLLVAAPITRRGRVSLCGGQHLNVYFNRSGSRYCFASHVLDRQTEDIRAAHIAPPDSLTPFERRRGVRVDAWMVPLAVTIPCEDDEDSWMKIPAKIWNISSSGLLLEAALPPGEWRNVILDIRLAEETRLIVAEGRVVNSRLAKTVRGQRQLTGVAFNRIDENDRDQIERFVFFQQMEITRKGLGGG